MFAVTAAEFTAEGTGNVLNKFSNKSPRYRHSRRRFGSFSTTRVGEDRRTPVSLRSMCGRRGEVRDALDESSLSRLPLDRGMDLQLSQRGFAPQGRHSESAPLTQPPVLPDVKWCCTTGTLSEYRRPFPGARRRLRSARRWS